jgi:predicted CDP-diglyceride synthetase/phosphatidate cytidylyltransferase
MPPPESIEDLNRRIHAWWAVFLVGVAVLTFETPVAQWSFNS